MDKIYEEKIILVDESIKQVDNQEDYDKYHAIYKKRMKKLTRDIKKYMYYPDEYLNEFEVILAEMVAYGIVSLEWSNSHRKKLYAQLNDPKEFVEWIKTKMGKLGKRFVKK